MKMRMGNVILGAVLVTLLTTGIGYADLSTGLVGYWSFDNPANLGYDVSGNYNNGSITGGATATSGVVGGAVHFNGSSYISIPDSSSLDLPGGSGTISAFVKVNLLSDDVGVVVKESNSSSVSAIAYEFFLRGYGTYFVFDISDGSNIQTVSDDQQPSLKDDQWHHIAATWSGLGGQICAYVDGVLIAQKSQTISTINNISAPVYMGVYRWQGGYRYGTADIDEVRIYNRALSEDEVNELVNSPPVAVCQDVLVAVGADGYVDASVDGGSYDPDGDGISFSQIPEGPYPVGVYNVELTVTDTHGASDSCQAMLVVYDPSGGFVTGGGWIWSPKGAYIADPWLEGKANFGFVSKYNKGASEPTGQTEFVFQAGDLNFHSSSYDWLVVNQNGSNAQFKGSGTINSEGNYKFMLWAKDGAPDTFRIKIWTEDNAGVETDVYDNGFDQPIGGGSIVVHTK
jgi:hypothetical protein